MAPLGTCEVPSHHDALAALHREHGSRGRTLRTLQPSERSQDPRAQGLKGGKKAKVALVCANGCPGMAVVHVRGGAEVTENDLCGCPCQGEGKIPIAACAANRA